MALNKHPWTRRAFLQSGLTVMSTAALLPAFLQSSAYGINDPRLAESVGNRPGIPDDRILVVVQLGGGNDGLNTIIPHGDEAYYRARGPLALRPENTLKLAEVDGYGLHPAMTGLMDLWGDGKLALIQGVGYPNPNRSHFKSMDIWHTADPEAGQGAGWLGRYMDNACAGNPQADLCVAIGEQAPLATQGMTVQPIAFQNAELFRWSGSELHPDVAKTYDQINRMGAADQFDEETPADFLVKTSLDAQLSSEKIRQAAAAQPLVTYPNSPLANDLKLIGAMIRAGLPTRVYYANMGGYDTHAGQLGRHNQLLRQYSEAVTAFYKDIKAQDNASRVCIVTFSEFGRRVRPNASAGTDHGTAAPMFVIGDMLKGGAYGSHPSLTELDRGGDMIYNTDFRSVYASVLEQWMQADSKKILRGEFKQLPIFAKG